MVEELGSNYKYRDDDFLKSVAEQLRTDSILLEAMRKHIHQYTEYFDDKSPEQVYRRMLELEDKYRDSTTKMFEAEIKSLSTKIDKLVSEVK